MSKEGVYYVLDRRSEIAETKRCAKYAKLLGWLSYKEHQEDA